MQNNAKFDDAHCKSIGITTHDFYTNLIGVCLNAGATIAQGGMTQIGQFEFSHSQSPYLRRGRKYPYNQWLIHVRGESCRWLLRCYLACQVALFTPCLSIGYIVNAIAAYYLFGEPLSSIRMLDFYYY